MNKFGKVQEGSNEGVGWIFPHFRSIKETSVAFIINKLFKSVLGRWEDLKVVIR